MPFQELHQTGYIIGCLTIILFRWMMFRPLYTYGVKIKLSELARIIVSFAIIVVVYFILISVLASFLHYFVELHPVFYLLLTNIVMCGAIMRQIKRSEEQVFVLSAYSDRTKSNIEQDAVVSAILAVLVIFV